MPKIKFNEQTYTALHTSATANKVLGVKQPKQKKAQKKARKTYTFPPLPSAYAALHFLLLRVRLSKDTQGTDMHPKKKEKN